MNRIIVLVIMFIVLQNITVKAQTIYKLIPDSIYVDAKQTATFSYPDCPYRLWETFPDSISFSIDNGATWQPSSKFNGTITNDGGTNITVTSNVNAHIMIREFGWVCGEVIYKPDTVVGIVQVGPYTPPQTKNSFTGNVVTPAGSKVKNVTINVINNNTVVSSYTDINGQYSDTLLSGNNYTIKPYKNNDVHKANGVTSLDIALIQSHILGKTKLNSPYKILAADVNGDGKVNSLDIVYIKRLILGTDTTFTNTTTKQNRLWIFVDSSYQFSDATNPFLPAPYTLKDSISFTGLSANKTNQSFIGIKLGDVNWDWKPTLPRMSETTFIKPYLPILQRRD